MDSNIGTAAFAPNANAIADERDRLFERAVRTFAEAVSTALAVLDTPTDQR